MLHLKHAPFDPDVVVIICNPKQAMQLAQAMVYTLGGRFEADFAGIQSICGDAVAGPYTTKRPNITLGMQWFKEICRYQIRRGHCWNER